MRWNLFSGDLDFEMSVTAAIGAADLKFLHRLRQARIGSFKSIGGTGNVYLPVPASLRSSFRRGRDG